MASLSLLSLAWNCVMMMQLGADEKFVVPPPSSSHFTSLVDGVTDCRIKIATRELVLVEEEGEDTKNVN
jgi:hypothetical protein